MKLDERIKSELENESQQIESILNDKQGMFELVLGSFNAGLGRWMILINVITLLLTILLFWTGYQFFVSTTLDDRVFWGVCVLLSGMVQIAAKQWIFLEMSRGSLIREIKRIEIEVVRLSNRLSQ